MSEQKNQQLSWKAKEQVSMRFAFVDRWQVVPAKCNIAQALRSRYEGKGRGRRAEGVDAKGDS